jgi:hypothetical protein
LLNIKVLVCFNSLLTELVSIPVAIIRLLASIFKLPSISLFDLFSVVSAVPVSMLLAIIATSSLALIVRLLPMVRFELSMLFFVVVAKVLSLML